MRSLSLLSALAFFVSFSHQTVYDIHAKLPPELSQEIVDLSLQIQQLCPNDEISFDWALPHITLYQTDFVNDTLDDVVAAMDQLAPTLHTCKATMGAPLLSGQYFMWEVSVPNDCLQWLSDSVVNATYQYRNKTQAIPEWVFDEPNPPRNEMILYCLKYGSPGVFDQFSPHVTLAWDSVDDMTPLLDLDYPPVEFEISVVGIGLVGIHGTVLRGTDLGTYTLPNEGEK
ncbi:hypothetical protein Pelo_10268 [Pelomyxa schiedti]|nr:hypothetical protein Pelo_10268 [Pelomyxa schiedti]